MAGSAIPRLFLDWSFTTPPANALSALFRLAVDAARVFFRDLTVTIGTFLVSHHSPSRISKNIHRKNDITNHTPISANTAGLMVLLVKHFRPFIPK
jgi:hypothetical protein